MSVENWRRIPIEGCEYEVSDCGRIKNKHGKIMSFYGIYLQVALSILGKRKGFSVHRLVAETFLDNPDKLPFVNHKDGNKHNNNISNLEWNTRAQDAKHVVEVLKKTKPAKAVLQFSKDLIFIKRFESIQKACDEIGAKDYHDIYSACRGSSKTSHGFVWKWADSIEEKTEIDLTQFIDIPGFDKYMVSKSGDIYGKIRKKILKPKSCGSRYRTVNLMSDGKEYSRLVHRLVALAYSPFNS